MYIYIYVYQNYVYVYIYICIHDTPARQSSGHRTTRPWSLFDARIWPPVGRQAIYPSCGFSKHNYTSSLPQTSAKMIWLVVSTPLTYICQFGLQSQYIWKNKTNSKIRTSDVCHTFTNISYFSGASDHIFNRKPLIMVPNTTANVQES